MMWRCTRKTSRRTNWLSLAEIIGSHENIRDTSIKFLVYIEPNIMEILNFQLHFRFCGSHLEFWKLLKGESSTPTWISFQGPHRLIISREKNYIKHFQVTPHGCWTIQYHGATNTTIGHIFPNRPVDVVNISYNFVWYNKGLACMYPIIHILVDELNRLWWICRPKMSVYISIGYLL